MRNQVSISHRHRARIAGKLAALTLTSAVGLACLLAVPAQANVTPLGATPITYTPASQSTCENPAWAWPFKSIGDSRTYVLAPSGSFTGGAQGWQLAGGARLAADSARGTSLVLPPGASAISPGMCVDLDYPHLRLAHKVVGRSASNVELRSEVVYPQLRSPVWTEVKQFDGYQGDPAPAGWRVSPDIDLKPDFGGSVPGARYVALRFTAVKKASTTAAFWIDDVFVDPRMR